MINLTTGSMASGMSHNVCTPPVVNGDPSRAVPVGDPGQGACIPHIYQPVAQLTGKCFSSDRFALGFDDLRFADCCFSGFGLDAPDGLLMGGVRSLGAGGGSVILTSVSGYRS